MLNPLVNLYGATGPDRIVTVLSIGRGDENHDDLGAIFSHTNWILHRADTRLEALLRLHQALIPVVVCETKLADGTWRDVFDDLGALADPPLLLVAARQADNALWAEVLNVGGYDVLSRPFDPDEVIRTVSLAWLHWKQATRRHAPLRAAV